MPSLYPAQPPPHHPSIATTRKRKLRRVRKRTTRKPVSAQTQNTNTSPSFSRLRLPAWLWTVTFYSHFRLSYKTDCPLFWTFGDTFLGPPPRYESGYPMPNWITMPDKEIRVFSAHLSYYFYQTLGYKDSRSNETCKSATMRQTKIYEIHARQDFRAYVPRYYP